MAAIDSSAAMNNATQGASIPDLLADMARGTLADFNIQFARLRKMFPDEVAEACLHFIASHEISPAGRIMAFWLSSQGKYINILFGSDAVPTDIGCKALATLKTVDEVFLVRFLKAAEQITAPVAMLRALSLVPGLGDYSILIPWLRKLCDHADRRVKSRAVRLLCEVRPNKAMVERQLLSSDARVRANAIEALWYARTPEANALFQAAANDPNHRVVGNALIGLHLQGNPSALTRMIEASRSPDPLFRGAMAWCFGFIGDERCIPLLEGLLTDPSVIVRKRAERSLAQTLAALGRTEPEVSPKREQTEANSNDAAAAAPSSP
jgi:hypothetical protein